MKKDWEIAVQQGDLNRVRSLLDSGADIDARDRHGQTGLMAAATKGHAEIVRLLVERGAQLNTTSKYQLSALMLAVIRDHVEIVKILADAGADREIRGTGAGGFAGQTALQLADKAGREHIASILRDILRDDATLRQQP